MLREKEPGKREEPSQQPRPDVTKVPSMRVSAMIEAGCRDRPKGTLPCEWLQSRDAASDQKSMMEMVWAKTCCEVRCHNRVAEKGRLGSQESEPSPSIRSPAMRFEQ